MNESILQFLVKSRQNTYASGVKAKVVDDMKVYSIKKGNLEYRDSYCDQHLVFQGQEILFEDNKPIWSMSYRGAVTDNAEPSAKRGRFSLNLEYSKNRKTDYPFDLPELD